MIDTNVAIVKIIDVEFDGEKYIASNGPVSVSDQKSIDVLNKEMDEQKQLTKDT